MLVSHDVFKTIVFEIQCHCRFSILSLQILFAKSCLHNSFFHSQYEITWLLYKEHGWQKGVTSLNDKIDVALM